jgi:hypothetical protein
MQYKNESDLHTKSSLELKILEGLVVELELLL